MAATCRIQRGLRSCRPSLNQKLRAAYLYDRSLHRGDLADLRSVFINRLEMADARRRFRGDDVFANMDILPDPKNVKICQALSTLTYFGNTN